MQTRQFASHLAALESGIAAGEIYKLLNKYFAAPPNTQISDPDKARFAELVFGIQAYVSRINEVESKLADDLGLTDLLKAPKLAALLTTFQNTANNNVLRTQHAFLNLLHQTDALLRLNRVVHKELVEPGEALHAPDHAIVSLEILDYEGDGIALQRMQLILQLLSELYAAVDQFSGGNSTPRVAYADSGSNITIGLEGVRETIDAIGALFARVWNALRFRKNDDFERNLDSALKGIDFLAQLKEQQAAGVLDEETSAKLARAVKRNVSDLVGAGVMIEDVEVTEHYDRIALLTQVRDRKLLASGDAASDAK